MPTPAAAISQQLELSNPTAEIPLLAIQAADELDELVHGRVASLEAVKALSEILKNSFRLNADSDSRKSFIDSGNVAVFSRAIEDWEPENRIATVSELVNRAMEIVQNLERSESAHDNTFLEKMRDFCVALSTAAASYRQSIYDLRPSHPFRS